MAKRFLGMGSAALSLWLLGGVACQGGSSSDENGGGYLERIPLTRAADKLDLLFMVDNSLSMLDKQRLLSEAVPTLLGRLVTPVCLNAEGALLGQSDAGGNCPAQTQAQFPPIRDIHVGVVTSSLGHHGSETCTGASEDDEGFLLGYPGLRPVPLVSWNQMGFLAWDPDGDRNSPPGLADAATFVGGLQRTIEAAGEDGCGYEASLEAWYRFLVDPLPPSAVAKDPDPTSPTYNQTITAYPSTQILAQRAAFLRPDSLVAIVMLTDENDCSIVDFGQGWLVGAQTTPGTTMPYRLPRSTSICEADPNARCCMSCLTPAESVPSGCALASADASCGTNGGYYTIEGDHQNLRCYEQKRRFGFELLYPISRYLDGLTDLLIYDRENALAQNPLFVAPDGMLPRDRSLVYLMGILGVPWQDLADEASLVDAGLRYLSFQELNDQGRWPMILGSPAANGVPASRPTDGLMFETTLDRSSLGFGPHPLTGDSIAPATTEMATLQNSINGHESVLEDGSDLQYACVFPLASPRECGAGDLGCECRPGNPENPEDLGDVVYNRSICDGSTQLRAKAYPGVRQLELLRAVGDTTGNAVVASICPKVSASSVPSTHPDYGYNPAVGALVDRIAERLQAQCLPRAFEVDAEGRLACSLIETLPPSGAGCAACGGGRSEVSSAIAEAVRRELETSGSCGGASPVACDEYCLCEIEQFAGADLNRCQTSMTEPADIAGFCYVDAEQGSNPALLQHCPGDRTRMLRFTGQHPPTNAELFLRCDGAPP